MNYELAKELKDAGFPHITISSGKVWIGTDWTSPTLSEFIEACGEKFSTLVQRNTGQCWGATGGGLHDERGSTPEEAVARLWLALNKKV